MENLTVPIAQSFSRLLASAEADTRKLGKACATVVVFKSPCELMIELWNPSADFKRVSLLALTAPDPSTHVSMHVSCPW